MKNPEDLGELGYALGTRSFEISHQPDNWNNEYWLDAGRLRITIPAGMGAEPITIFAFEDTPNRSLAHSVEISHDTPMRVILATIDAFITEHEISLRG